MSEEMTSKEKARHFQNALSNYGGVLANADELELYEIDEEFPYGWTDPLELYGNYAQALDRVSSRDWERDRLKEIMSDERSIHDAAWVWDNRRRLVAERLYCIDFFGG